MNAIATAPLRAVVDEFIVRYGEDGPMKAWLLIAERMGYASASSAQSSVKAVLSGDVVNSARRDFDAIDWTDRLLVALDAIHVWADLGSETVESRPGVRCEDCGKGPLDPDDYRRLDLMRRDPSASRWVWDSTKQKPVYRPRNAAVGGRRFRQVDLCRRCAGEALRQRAAKGGTVMERGKKRALRTRERVAPKRGGRPRLLNEQQLRTLHDLYEREGLSLNDLAEQLLAGGKVKGTKTGLYQSMLYGWRKLDLPLRPQGEAIALAHHRRGRKPADKRKCPATTAKGTACTLGPKRDGIYCVSHQHLEAAAA